jgi:NADPH-dependent 2,4-dienoyl-CoA reductase/sulfur reductase-like enzyme
MTDRMQQCDVLVIGAGPAGIAAAVRARELGAKVVVADDNACAGGQIWRRSQDLRDDRSAPSRLMWNWLDRFQKSGAVLLSHTRIVAPLDSNLLLAEDDSGGLRIRYRSVVLATGARERLLPFPGWTLPNVLGVGGAQALEKAGLSLRGKRVAVAGSGPLLLAVAATLCKGGAAVVGVFEQAPRSQVLAFGASLVKRPQTLIQAATYLRHIGIKNYYLGWWPIAAKGKAELSSVVVTDGKLIREIDCNYVACGYHLLPNTELASMFGCHLENGGVVVDANQQSSVPGIYAAGEAIGVAGLDCALVEGEIAGGSAFGVDWQSRSLHRERNSLRRMASAMNEVFRLRPELRSVLADDTIVCRCEDVNWGRVRRYGSMRSAKIHTRCGMGSCQGRICGAALQFLVGWEGDTSRPPLYPVRLSTLLSGVNQKEDI